MEGHGFRVGEGTRPGGPRWEHPTVLHGLGIEFRVWGSCCYCCGHCLCFRIYRPSKGMVEATDLSCRM